MEVYEEDYRGLEEALRRLRRDSNAKAMSIASQALKLPKAQDETGGFLAFIPLAFHFIPLAFNFLALQF